MDVWTDFIAGCFGGIYPLVYVFPVLLKFSVFIGMAGTFAGHPMDTIKVRQQLNASQMSARRFIELSFQQEGVLSLSVK